MEDVVDQPAADLNTTENFELEDLLDDALGDFETQTSSTQTACNTESKSTGTDEKITKFGNNQLHSGHKPSKRAKFDFNNSDSDGDGEENNSNISSDNNSNINIEYVDKLLNDFEQKINNIMSNTAKIDLNDDDNKNNETLTDEIQKKFTKMAEDTMSMLINQGLVNKDGTYANSNNDTKSSDNNNTSESGNSSITDFKGVISRAIKNLCRNSEELEGGILMNSSDDIANLINDLTFKDDEQVDENEIEGHFAKIFIKIGQMLLYPPLKDICDKYPTYLADNKLKLPKETFDNYEKQFLNMAEICKVFEEENPGTGTNDFQHMLAVMQEIQNCGLPPEELVQGNPFKTYDDMVASFCYQNMNNLKNLQCSIS